MHRVVSDLRQDEVFQDVAEVSVTKLRPKHYVCTVCTEWRQTWDRMRFFRMWLRYQWPSSCPNTARTSSLLQPVFLCSFLSSAALGDFFSSVFWKY